jgi:hypothetical protein
MKSIKLNELVKIMETRLSTSLFNSFLDILLPIDDNNENGVKLQYERFEYILRNALTQHMIHFPNEVVSPISIKNNKFEFLDNFDSYLLDPINFGEDNILLIPEYIINMNYSRISKRLPISKSNYDYKKPYLFSVIKSIVWVNYGTYYPIRLNYALDGRFTEDSYLYYLDQSSQQFLTRLEYEILVYLKNMHDQLELSPIPVKIFSNLNTQVDRVRQDLDTWIKTNHTIISFWSS